MPKVSVVIPAYNSVAYLPETINSVLSQSFKDFEVLVINDGSTDATEEWFTQNVKDPRVKLISQENQGLSGARNTGIQYAQGDYIALLDADDLWEPTKLEKQVLCLEANPEVGLVYTWTALIDQYSKPTGRIVAHHAEGNVWQTLLEVNVVASGSNPLIRRDCFDNVGLFDINLSSNEDRDMWLRIASKYLFAVIKEPLVLYRQHQGNMSKDFSVMLKNCRIVIERAFASAPTEILHLRNRSYGSLNLYLAWKAIDSRNYQQAIHFRQQAIAHLPQLVFSRNYIRLSIAISLIRLFGFQFYKNCINLSHFISGSMLRKVAK
ncbi:glycosyltransferase family 2 protein [Anabaena subtropica]|uniref:Glycosyltransferase family 2 protein n=1 Tax=Anabaena subtropica FACHB-260 TaxID=2692884 RepID=A0ABR8CQA4_9NOST|nr:glycosyltransferase family A protein [Anabaena subtropica]MBD2345351.1 glycosyltransferase family 2 protein [Anabaena subtropica FACHB-260]